MTSMETWLQNRLSQILAILEAPLVFSEVSFSEVLTCVKSLMNQKKKPSSDLAA